jgi:hypothetical protein
MRTDSRNLFRFLFQRQALIGNQGCLETQIDWTSQRTEIAHGILSSGALFQTRSRIDGIGLESCSEIARLRIRSDRLGKRFDFDADLLRTPGIHNRNRTEIGTRKVQTGSSKSRCGALRRQCKLDSNVPSEFDKLESRDLAIHLEIALGPGHIICILLPERSLGLSSRGRQNLTGNCCRIGTKLNGRYYCIALLLKGLTQECDGKLLGIARNDWSGQNIDFFDPVESTRQEVHCFGRNTATRWIACGIKELTASCSRIAYNHKSLRTFAIRLETCIDDNIVSKVVCNGNLSVQLILVVNSNSITRSPELIRL